MVYNVIPSAAQLYTKKPVHIFYNAGIDALYSVPLYIVYTVVYSVQCTLYNIQCSVYTVQYTVFIVHCVLCSVYNYIIHCTLNI